jgi:hypothetical protein
MKRRSTKGDFLKIPKNMFESPNTKENEWIVEEFLCKNSKPSSLTAFKTGFSGTRQFRPTVVLTPKRSKFFKTELDC